MKEPTFEQHFNKQYSDNFKCITIQFEITFCMLSSHYTYQIWFLLSLNGLWFDFRPLLKEAPKAGMPCVKAPCLVTAVVIKKAIGIEKKQGVRCE